MQKITKAVIPVAGFGTRFLPATKAQPKEMLPLVDKPIIQYIVEEAVAAGITQIVFITGSNKRAIEDHFDRNFELEYRLQKAGKDAELTQVKDISSLATFIYIRQKTQEGLGHAILQAKPVIDGEPFAVLLGDDVIFGDTPAIGQLADVYKKFGEPVVGVTEVAAEQVKRYGIIDGEAVDDNVYKVRRIVEKPTPETAPSRLGVTGRYIFTPDIFDEIEQTKPGVGGEIQITDAMANLMTKRPLYACRYHGDYYDCGDKERYLEAQLAVGLQRPDLAPGLKGYLKSVLE